MRILPEVGLPFRGLLLYSKANKRKVGGKYALFWMLATGGVRVERGGGGVGVNSCSKGQFALPVGKHFYR